MWGSHPTCPAAETFVRCLTLNVGEWAAWVSLSVVTVPGCVQGHWGAGAHIFVSCVGMEQCISVSISSHLKLHFVILSGFNNTLCSLCKNEKITPSFAIIMSFLCMFSDTGGGFMAQGPYDWVKKQSNVLYGVTSVPWHLTSRCDVFKDAVP